MVVPRSLYGLLLVSWLVGCAADPEGATTKTTPAAITPAAGTMPGSGPSDPAPSPVIGGPVTEDVAGDDWAIEPDFQPLRFADFQVYPADSGSWSVTQDAGGGEVIRCTGKPKGYLRSQEAFTEFHWRWEYRYLVDEKSQADPKFKGNTGFLFGIVGEDRIWPYAIEVQGKWVGVGGLKENGGAPVPLELVDLAEIRTTHRRPPGAWQQLELVATAADYRVLLNGHEVCTAKPAAASETETAPGALGIQAEDFPFEVRRLRVRRTASIK